jgi:hypothetical protein
MFGFIFSNDFLLLNYKNILIMDCSFIFFIIILLYVLFFKINLNCIKFVLLIEIFALYSQLLIIKVSIFSNISYLHIICLLYLVILAIETSILLTLILIIFKIEQKIKKKYIY